jgi:hypothetical protein
MSPPTRLRGRVLALLALLAALLSPLGAEAAAPAAVMPVESDFPAMTTGRPPSAEHPKGTVLLFDVRAPNEAVALEWDVAGEKVVVRRSLGTIPPSTMARAALAGGRIYVVFGSWFGRDEPVVLMRVTPELTVEARQEIGHGTMPSVDADASSNTVVAAFFEERPPVSGPEGRTIVLAAPSKIMTVQARNAATLGLLSARWLRGADGALLAPHVSPTRAARAVAIHDGRVVVALPLRRATRIVVARLPQLVLDGDREVPWNEEPFGSLALVRAGAGVVALGGPRPVDVAGAPSITGAERAAVERGDDPVVAGGAIHWLTFDRGRVLFETRALAPSTPAPRPPGSTHRRRRRRTPRGRGAPPGPARALR